MTSISYQTCLIPGKHVTDNFLVFLAQNWWYCALNFLFKYVCVHEYVHVCVFCVLLLVFQTSSQVTAKTSWVSGRQGTTNYSATKMLHKAVTELFAAWLIAPSCWKSTYFFYSSLIFWKNKLEIVKYIFLILLSLKRKGSNNSCCNDGTPYTDFHIM